MIVCKFGGTSVQDAAAIERLVRIVSQRREERPLVVVSALAKVTDALARLAETVRIGDAGAINDVLDALPRDDVEEAVSAAAERVLAAEPGQRPHTITPRIPVVAVTGQVSSGAIGTDAFADTLRGAAVGRLHCRILLRPRRPGFPGVKVVDLREHAFRRRVHHEPPLDREGIGLTRGEEQHRGDEDDDTEKQFAEHVDPYG